ncbi:MAG: RNA 2',3'-cyclic phosphodiesterase [Ardenticatenaceae bacterium]|nr:RNA 2',3'-cyclic phosphodiesterase [Ardenticatenaceae bacterium]MCB8988540.1 RNA 2',3'-cyclic phosphodiesterase [Ardenticatenaceae bacterium]
MDVIRAFIAVEMPTAVKQELARAVNELDEQIPQGSVRWVKPELMHLTLVFLGDTAVSKLPSVTAALDEAAQTAAPFTLHLSEMGCFPNRQRPRVIWVGLDGHTQPLLALKRAVDEALVPLGWAAEKRPFQAHLTLGRVKDARQLRNVNWGTKVKELAVPVTAVHLMESQLQRGGPLYTVRHSSTLAG